MSKELLFAALRHEETERAPWVPFAGVHAGLLIGKTATEVLQNEDALVESLLEVHKLYKPDGQPMLFDLQLEAEILGCDLRWADDNPPSVCSHPLEGDDMPLPDMDKIPGPNDGRMPLVLSTMRRMKKEVGDTTALYGLFCGPFTLASHLRGNDLFMDMYDDEDYVHDLMGYCTKVGKAMIDMYVDAGMDVVAVVDPLVSQISPDHFTEFMHPYFKDLFDYIREKGVFSSLFVCGDATKNMEVMCKTDPDSIHIDENVDMVGAKKVADQYNVAMGGNIPLTSIMLLGNQLDNMKAVVDLIDAVNSKQNFILAPG